MFSELKQELLKHIKKSGLEKPLNACHVCFQAREILSEELKKTQANITKFQQGKIFIKCPSSVAKHEFFYNKRGILKKLKSQITATTIEEIVIY